MDSEVRGSDVEIDDPLADAPPSIPIEDSSKLRCIFTHEPPTNEENILIVNRAVDISCIGQGFSIMFHCGKMTKIGLALAKSATSKFDIVTAAAVVIDPTISRNLIVIINQTAYIPNLVQHESLLHSDQTRSHNVFIYDLARCFQDPEGRAGHQNIEVEGCTITLKHDGAKYFLHIRESTKGEWKICQVLELTSPEPWQHGSAVHRMKQSKLYSEAKVKEWSYRLGRFNPEATRYTLTVMTQLVKSIEAENRLVPRRHLKCRLPYLRPRRLMEGFSSDTIFPEIKAVRSFT